MDVEAAAPPAVEEHYREHDDHHPDRGLRIALERLRQVPLVEDDRYAEHEQARAVAEAPDEAEACRAAGGAFLSARDQRRHGGEMIRVRGMAEAEHERDDDHDQQRGAVGHRGDLVVEAEHHATLGIAWTVISTPATRMTAALSAGSARSTRPSNFARPNTRLASTATRPTPVIESASPRLNATISSSPNPTRWSEIAPSSTTSADWHGSSPPETPTANSERRLGESCSWW